MRLILLSSSVYAIKSVQFLLTELLNIAQSSFCNSTAFAMDITFLWFLCCYAEIWKHYVECHRITVWKSGLAIRICDCMDRFWSRYAQGAYSTISSSNNMVLSIPSKTSLVAKNPKSRSWCAVQRQSEWCRKMALKVLWNAFPWTYWSRRMLHRKQCQAGLVSKTIKGSQIT